MTDKKASTERNTGALHCVQDDGAEPTTAGTSATADPCGMTIKKNRQEQRQPQMVNALLAFAPF
jgi:hypothetical protein